MIERVMEIIGAREAGGSWYMPYSSACIDLFKEGFATESDVFVVIGEIKHWLRAQGWDWFCTNFYENKAIVECMRGFYGNCDSAAAEATTELEAWGALVMKVQEDK